MTLQPGASQQDDLVARVRAALSAEPNTREVSMFGGRSFLVDEAIVVAARTGGDLLVRVDPTQDAELLTRPGASRAMMGAERSMGPGWISVAAEALVAKADLNFWIETALSHRRAL